MLVESTYQLDFPCPRSIATSVEAQMAATIAVVWRQHSWVLDRQRTGIIETTERRQLYWGLVMTTSEARAFAEDNW